MATTLQTLIQNIARDGYGYVTITPSATGTTTTVTANAVGSNLDPDDPASLYYSAWLKCESDTADPALNVGVLRRLDRTTGYVATTGVLTTTRAFANNTTTTQTFGIYLGLPPTTQGLDKGIEEYINEVLRRLYYRDQYLLTLVTDGDMEATGIANWTEANSATATKSTSTGVTLGKQALRVANSAANGRVQSATVNVEPGQSYLLAADVRVASGTAVLELYDVTNSASILTKTSAERQTRRIWLQTSLPSSCRQVAVRLNGTEATADVYWDNVSLLNSTATEMDLPSWFDNPDWLERVTFWYPGPTGVSADHAAVDAIERREARWWGVFEARNDLTPYKVLFEPYVPPASHLIAECLRPYAELAADADTTEADADWVKAWALALIGEDKKDEAMVKRWLPKAQILDKQFQKRWNGRRYMLRTSYQ